VNSHDGAKKLSTQHCIFCNTDKNTRFYYPHMGIRGSIIHTLEMVMFFIYILRRLCQAKSFSLEQNKHKPLSYLTWFDVTRGRFMWLLLVLGHGCCFGGLFCPLPRGPKSRGEARHSHAGPTSTVITRHSSVIARDLVESLLRMPNRGCTDKQLHS
jgi:hypothetical protein